MIPQDLPEPAELAGWPDQLESLTPGRYIVRVPVARLLSGHELCQTVHIVRGPQPGPALGLLSGIHGDEVTGIRCLRHILASVPESDLRGTLVAVPVANPLAWGAGQRVTPEINWDNRNLARQFNSPARDAARLDATGSLTRRMAAALEHTFFTAITQLVDYHNYGRDTAVRLLLYRTGQDEATLATSLAMARAFELGTRFGVTGSQGTTSAYAADHGIPCVVAEWGGTGLHRQADDETARLGGDGGLRVMRALGMIGSAPEAPGPCLVVERVIAVMPQHSGYFLPDFDLEDLFLPAHHTGIPVQAGQTLGRVLDSHSLACVETLAAPEDGYLVALVRGGPLESGSRALSLAVGHLE